MTAQITGGVSAPKAGAPVSNVEKVLGGAVASAMAAFPAHFGGLGNAVAAACCEVNRILAGGSGGNRS